MDPPDAAPQEFPPGTNEDLRARHLAELRHEAALSMYDRTLRQCAERPGGLRPTDQDMIADLCSAEDIKIDLQEEIKKRGVMVETRNGRQTFRKENPAMARLCRYTELQRKLRADLGLVIKRKAENGEEEPEADEFDSY